MILGIFFLPLIYIVRNFTNIHAKLIYFIFTKSIDSGGQMFYSNTCQSAYSKCIDRSVITKEWASEPFPFFIHFDALKRKRQK